jgi:hypothetical protein
MTDLLSRSEQFVHSA